MLNISIYGNNQSVIKRAQNHINKGKSQHVSKTQYYDRRKLLSNESPVNPVRFFKRSS